MPSVQVWQRVQKEINSTPIAEGLIGGKTPVYCQRYLVDGMDRVSRALPILGLAVQLGGARIREGESGRWRAQTLPGQSMLIPAGCATHWHYSGTADFVLMFFPDATGGIVERLGSLTRGGATPLLFNDMFVGAAALTVVEELGKAGAADEAFMENLVAVMLEKVYRALTLPAVGGLSPRHIHFNRLQKVIPYIRTHLADDLTLSRLSALCGVGERQFRRLFQETTGMTVHQYVRAARLEQARKLLGASTLPIARIAQACGFSSQSHLTASFRAAHTVTPADYRRKLSGARPGAKS